jgi:PAS domain S-box-containing protein
MGGPISVLFVEDREDDALLVLRELARAGYDVTHVRVDTESRMREELARAHWDIVLSDYSMPQFNAVRALEVLKDTGIDLPFIIISGTIGEDTAVAALKAGAHDFIPKGSLKRLIPAIERERREAVNRHDRQRAERELRTSLETIGALFAASPLPMFLLDAQGLVQRWNPAAERVFGWTAEEVVGGPLPFVQPEEIAEYRGRINLLLAGESVAGERLLRVRKDGSIIRTLASAAPVRNAAGEVVAVMGIVDDITAQHDMEEQFRQAQKMEAVGRLAGGIAHDFNNVLTAIEGFAGLLLSDMDADDKRRQDVVEIVTAAERAASFTRQLLTFSRKQVLQPTWIEINPLLTDLKKLLERMIGENIIFEMELSNDALFVHADRGQLEQVVLNLVLNARDAISGSGSIRLCASCCSMNVVEAEKEAVAPGMYCGFDVVDSGSGIPSDVLPHIFDPFFTTKEAGKGTGLGLSTVYGVVRQNGGFIKVQSRPGVGTRFSALFPRGLPPQGVAPAATGTVQKSQGKRLRILVVEDEPAIRVVIDRTLKRAGYDTVLTGDPVQALEALKRDASINLLITDLMLPVMTGKDLVREARRGHPELRVIYMSGYANELLSVDNDHPYLEKPFAPADLLQKLRDTLGTDAEVNARAGEEP